MFLTIGIPSGWADLAGMLTVLTVLGGLFTWVVFVLIDKRVAVLEKSMRATFITNKEIDIILKQADQTHKRHEDQFRDVWKAITDLRKVRHP